MMNRKNALASLLATLMPVAIGACGSDKPPAGTGGTGGRIDGSGGSGGNRPVDAGRADIPAIPPPPRDAGPPPPDVPQTVSYTFDTDTQGWLTAPYGSTPEGMPNAPNNLARTSTLVFDPTNDVDGRATSGSLKATVPYQTTGERVDFQAFSVANGMYNWAGHIVTARVKLQSGGNLNPNCPLRAAIYVSQAPDYNTNVSPLVSLVPGSWVTVTYDMAEVVVDVTRISQMGVQVNTGGVCDAPFPDGGARDVADARTPDAGPDAGRDAGTDAGTDAGPSDAGEAGVPLPITATTAVMFVDSVIVSVK